MPFWEESASSSAAAKSAAKKKASSGGGAPPPKQEGFTTEELLEQGMNLLQEYKARVDKECEAAIARKLRNPGHGAVDFNQSILTLGGLKDQISRAMANTLNDWIDRSGNDAPHQQVLPHLFLECDQEVLQRCGLIKSILFPTGGGADTNCMLMREHMCNNHKELFHLMPGRERDQALGRVLHGVCGRLTRQSISHNQAKWLVEQSGLEVVALKYLEILVQVRLQHPPATFSDNCGVVQAFNPHLHSRPVDGGGIRKGERCIVVFPAMLVGEATCTVSWTLGDVMQATPSGGAMGKTASTGVAECLAPPSETTQIVREAQVRSGSVVALGTVDGCTHVDHAPAHVAVHNDGGHARKNSREIRRQHSPGHPEADQAYNPPSNPRP